MMVNPKLRDQPQEPWQEGSKKIGLHVAQQAQVDIHLG